MLIFTAVVTGAACGGDAGADGVDPIGFRTPSATTGATNEPEATATEGELPTATTAASAEAPANPPPTATQSGGGSGSGGGNGGTVPAPTSTQSAPANILPCGDILVPLNKQNALPANCSPGDLDRLPGEISHGGDHYLRAAASAAIQEMFADAAEDGIQLFVVSSFRSYQTQVDTFNFWVQTQGIEQAERTSARPGHSEHQLGTTADVTAESVGFDLSESFGGTAEGRWVAENSWRYGFVISYPAGSEHITGYAYEPWHIRYIGRGEAENVKNSGLTLHEYLQR